MLSPSLYVVIAYMLAVPMCVAIYSSVQIRGAMKIRNLLIVGLLLAGVLFALYRGIDAVFVMSFISLGIFLFGILCSACVAVLCIREREAERLRLSSVATAVGYYLFFMMLIFLVTPTFRFCGGCGEWH